MKWFSNISCHVHIPVGSWRAWQLLRANRANNPSTRLYQCGHRFCLAKYDIIYVVSIFFWSLPTVELAHACEGRCQEIYICLYRSIDTSWCNPSQSSGNVIHADVTTTIKSQGRALYMQCWRRPMQRMNATLLSDIQMESRWIFQAIHFLFYWPYCVVALVLGSWRPPYGVWFYMMIYVETQRCGVSHHHPTTTTSPCMGASVPLSKANKYIQGEKRGGRVHDHIKNTNIPL